MSYHARTILPPGASRKRKERESYYPFKPSASIQLQAARPISKAEFPEKQNQGVFSNRLLAGYMAHEFLTKGTLFGQKFDPARAEAVPVGPEWKRGKETGEAGGIKEHKSYGEVASILKSDGTHIPGIVNPTQLARWIQM